MVLFVSAIQLILKYWVSVGLEQTQQFPQVFFERLKQTQLVLQAFLNPLLKKMKLTNAQSVLSLKNLYKVVCCVRTVVWAAKTLTNASNADLNTFSWQFRGLALKSAAMESDSLCNAMTETIWTATDAHQTARSNQSTHVVGEVQTARICAWNLSHKRLSWSKPAKPGYSAKY